MILQQETLEQLRLAMSYTRGYRAVDKDKLAHVRERLEFWGRSVAEQSTAKAIQPSEANYVRQHVQTMDHHDVMGIKELHQRFLQSLLIADMELIYWAYFSMTPEYYDFGYPTYDDLKAMPDPRDYYEITWDTEIAEGVIR